MGWDLKQLRDDVEAAFGRDQRALLGPSLQSVVERRAFCRFHHTEATRLVETASAGQSESDRMMWILGGGPEDEHEFTWVRFQAAAHITACVQSLHSVADILAHVVYFARGMNLGHSTMMVGRDISSSSVRRRLPPGEILDAMSAFVADGFGYIAALVNASKHRSIVNVGYSIDLTGADELPHGLKFTAFEHHGVTYPARWVTPTLSVEYERQERLLHTVGPLLNREVARPAC